MREPTLGKTAGLSPRPALRTVLAAPSELKFTAGGAGAYGPGGEWLTTQVPTGPGVTVFTPPLGLNRVTTPCTRSKWT